MIIKKNTTEYRFELSGFSSCMSNHGCIGITNSIFRVFILYKWVFLFASFLILAFNSTAQISTFNPVWYSQSENSSESMPLGGGDIGLNVWAENGDILFYIARSGTFDENNSLLKLGRVRLRLSPNPFDTGESFKQELHLQDGYILLSGKKGNHESTIKLWVDVFNPVVHIDIKANQALDATATYETWRYQDRVLKGKENNQNSYKWAPQGEVKTDKDSMGVEGEALVFYHQNKPHSVFDITVKQQGLDQVKEKLFNPLENLVFGGKIEGQNFTHAGSTEGKYIDTKFRGWILKSKSPSKNHALTVTLHTQSTPSVEEWKSNLNIKSFRASQKKKQAFAESAGWWKDFWNRSFIIIDSDKKMADSLAWQVGRNYQLMRYMLGANRYGSYPSKFNGGLFTYDPSLTDTALKFTPDFRNWGGGTHTAQNQRLLYWPMLKSGDFDLMLPQFDFYLNLQHNAELRSEVYWKHKGASFTEQLENFGLPNPAEYNWKRPRDYDPGMEHNAWLEYEWDTVLEFCMMMLETERYAEKDIKKYIPFIESCLVFFDEHYQYLAKQRGSKVLDMNGKLVFYPGSATETYKMAYNANSTVAAIRTVLERLLELPATYSSEEQRSTWQTLLAKIPEVSFRHVDGKTMIAPAKLWERVNNTESPQLYPVFPWGMFGIGKPGLDTAMNTFLYDPDVIKFRSHIGWKQDNIFAARLGLREEAWRLTHLKLKNSSRRFPSFWGPGFDWTPDHNWGGSGMIGLQEMLLQADGRKILLFPSWLKDKDVHFKLHAPYQTTVEAKLTNGKISFLKVVPESRKKDICILLENESSTIQTVK